jgi:hypothetical protein
MGRLLASSAWIYCCNHRLPYLFCDNCVLVHKGLPEVVCRFEDGTLACLTLHHECDRNA